MEPTMDLGPRTYVIRRDEHLGYGFVVGSEMPTMVKVVNPNGPSFKRLLPYDIIMIINGVKVEDVPKDQITKMIQLCDQIEVTVRQATYEQRLRAQSHVTNPKFCTLNRTHDSLINNSNFSNTLNNRNSIRGFSTSSITTTPSPLSRLVTPMAQQQQFSNGCHSGHDFIKQQPLHTSTKSPFLTNGNGNQPVQIQSTTESVLRPNTNSNNIPQNNSTHDTTQSRTLGRNCKLIYGRHSPLPQRCKSSTGHQNGITNKNSPEANNDQPCLKRSNTMRPIKNIFTKEQNEISNRIFRVFIEDCGYRSFEVKSDTIVGKILEKLYTRLEDSPHGQDIKKCFGLALTAENQKKGASKEAKAQRLYILKDHDSIGMIKMLPYAKSLTILYRMVYPPADVEDLYRQHKLAFNYLYRQSCNDLIHERFYPKIDQDTALKFSALHLIEYVNSTKPETPTDCKKYLKLIEDDQQIGMRHFLPESILDATLDKKGKRKEGLYKKLRNKFLDKIRENMDLVESESTSPPTKTSSGLTRYPSTSFHELTGPEAEMPVSDRVKLAFLKRLSELPCYGNYRKPVRSSSSPVDRGSVNDCSSSMESVPRTSDSSPLIRQDNRIHNDHLHENIGYRTDQVNNHNNISRLAQMNSMRSLSSVPSSNTSQPIDRTDMPQTPSIESISSITFNMQNSPSPQQMSTLLPQLTNGRGNPSPGENYLNLEPYPMPRQQVLSKLQDYNSVEKLYNQRYNINERPIDELLRSVMLLPPPPPISEFLYQLDSEMIDFEPRLKACLTQELTDRDIESLRVPPPPRILN